MILQVKDLILNQNSELRLEDTQVPGELKTDLSNDELFLAPGLIDLQINGYKGVDFNNEALSVEKIENAVYELLKDGVTGFLPTFITNDPMIVEENLSLFNQAMEKNSLVRDCILGFHMEGPFISAIEGARGAHPVQWVLEPDLNLLDKWQKLTENKIKLLTLSPEYQKSIDFIKACRENGIKVAIGHSSATSEQVHYAVSAGADLSTHLGNGLPRTLHRHKNILFEQIANDGLYASIIADGHHLPPDLIKIILRSKPGRVFLISDSTMYAGMQPGAYTSFIGGKVQLKENKRLSLFDKDEYLAGSASYLYECVNHLSRENLSTLSQAWEMASVIPFKYLSDKELRSARKKERVLFTYKNDVIKIVLTLKNDQLFHAFR
ncbi:N-acetylglucosamine-6-phosphate deacetylase [Bacteroidota bacterium]